MDEAVTRFAHAVGAKFETGVGEPEEHLRTPFEALLHDIAGLAGITDVRAAGEHHLADERIRPDYSIHVNGALVGFVELKAPGKGVDVARFRGTDRRQWQRLACLPNVLYGDGNAFALFRDGERFGRVVRLAGDVASGELEATDDGLLALLEDFLRWQPIAPRRPKELASIAARLCRVLRDEVHELLGEGVRGLHDLAHDWRELLYPDATDEEFADGYAQTVTFALLLARVEGISLDGERDLRDVADDLGSRHTLMARALAVLTDPAVLPRLAVSVNTLKRVLAVVDWPTLSRNDPAASLYFYEDFLEQYDPKLRRQTGSYYTPVQAVEPIVRLVDDLLRTRLGHQAGFASNEVTVVDPAAGTGSFLLEIIERVAERVGADQGPGAVGPAVHHAARRLIGFEMQAGPYSVAEVRLATELKRLGATLGRDDLRLYLTNALADPFVEQAQLAATYRPIAESRRRANEVKRAEPVMVVIGNPPYKERSRGLGEWVESGSRSHPALLDDFMPPKDLGLGAHVKHLYNLYAYFWRWGAWKVFEYHPGNQGVVAFITVAGFLHGPGFAQMRSHLRRWADEVWVIDCSPEGHQPEVATRIFAGVQQPICITIALRDGSTEPTTPAPVRFTSVEGSREQKFAALRELEIDGPGWLDCPDDWHAPFLPKGAATWSAMPALDDLLAWSGSGTMPGRTWVVGPSAEILRARWRRLITAPVEERSRLLAEHRRDRRIDTQLSENLPGYAPRGTIAAESQTDVVPVRYALRTLDRGWIIPDKRVINQPNPGLWQIRDAPPQIFVTTLEAHAPRAGPAASFACFVPDLDHYHGRGGRAYPLWLDSAGTRPNVVPGLLEHLTEIYGTDIAGPDLFAYVAAITAHPAYVDRFRVDLQTPGLRIPLTAVADRFSRAAELGRRVVWLHTYGERFVDPAAGRPPGSPRVGGPNRPFVVEAIRDDEANMPETIEYDPATETLRLGAGRVSGVTPAMWEYETSGYKIVRRWFARRKRDPDGRRSSPLDEIVARTWDPEWTTELIDLLHVVALLVDMETGLAALLDEILAGALLSVDDLTAAGVLPVTARPVVESPPRQGQLV